MKKVLLNKQALTGYTIYQTAPVGTVFDFAGIDIPDGFLPCDGRALLRSEYAELFKVIGTIYGEGDGETTFNIPDTIEKVIEGASVNTVGKVYEAGLPNITGELERVLCAGNGAFTPIPNSGNYSISADAYSVQGSKHNVSFDASKGETKSDGTVKKSSDKKVFGNSDTVQMDAVGMFKIIKVKSYMLDNPEGRAEKPVYEVPVGTILSSGCSIAPAGYLMCDGKEYSRELFADLFNAIGTKYGAGDGETTFNVPDGRECNLVGVGESDRNDIKQHDVYRLGEFKDDQFQGHKHSMYWRNFGGPLNDYNYGTKVWRETGANVNNPAYLLGGDIAELGEYGTPRSGTTTHGKQIGVNYIIKALKTTAQPSSDIEIDDTKTTNTNVLSALETQNRIDVAKEEAKLESYSTEEKIVGMIGNKPLYAKYYHDRTTRSGSPNANIDSFLTNTNIEYFEINGSIVNSDNNLLPIGYKGSYNTDIRVSANGLIYDVGFSTKGFDILVKYTKTTD